MKPIISTFQSLSINCQASRINKFGKKKKIKASSSISSCSCNQTHFWDKVLLLLLYQFNKTPRIDNIKQANLLVVIQHFTHPLKFQGQSITGS